MASCMYHKWTRMVEVHFLNLHGFFIIVVSCKTVSSVEDTCRNWVIFCFGQLGEQCMIWEGLVNPCRHS